MGVNMEVWLIWAAIFAGGAFGVLIALLIAAERELRRFKEVARSADNSTLIVGPTSRESKPSERHGHVADLERDNSQLLAQIAELKAENKAKQDRIIQLNSAQGQRQEIVNDRFPEMEKKVAGLEKEKSQLLAQVTELRSAVEANKEKLQVFESTQRRSSEMGKRIEDLEEEKARLAAELAELKREAAMRQEKIRWVEDVQDKLRETERRASDLLNGLRTVMRGGHS
jgi:chromosome segregation ATPase